MKQENTQLNKNQKKSLLKTFLISVGITLAVSVVLIGIGVWSYYTYIYDGTAKETSNPNEILTPEDEAKKELSNVNLTLAVFGVDADETRTDVSFVVNFNSKTNKVKVVSLPRDTKVNWSEEQRAKLKEQKGYSIQVSKLNEMSAYGGMKNIRDYTIDEIENILGVKVDNYIVVNLEAFRKIVDTIGGVEVDVPQNMNYDDPTQDLHIHLTQGPQHLDGDKAEQLVRFRRYLRGDEDRIVVQQLFLKNFAEKLMKPENITKLPQFATIVFKYLTTDISLSQMGQYYPYAKNFKVENLSFGTLPGEGRMENGVSYFFIDQEELPNFIEEVFFDREVAGSEESTGETAVTEPVIDKAVSIEVLNAAGERGLAGRVKDTLEKEAYKVQKIGNYTEGEKETTLIYAKDRTKGEQFKKYFQNATVMTRTTIDSDVQILVGKDFITN